MNKTFTSVLGANIQYRDNGKETKSPLLFIHGFPLKQEMWQPQVEALTEKFRVITYDQRGFGNSDTLDGQYTFEIYVDDLIGLLDHLKIPRAILVGFSLGGYVALRAIERAPERIMGLVLANTQSKSDNDEAKLKRGKVAKEIKQNGLNDFAQKFPFAILADNHRERLSRPLEEMIKSNYPLGVSAAAIAMATRTDTSENLSSIRVPTLIIHGEKDPVISLSSAEEMHSKIPGSSLIILPGVAHAANLEDPKTFNEELTSFLKKHSF